MYCQTNRNAYYSKDSYIIFVKEELFLSYINYYLNLAIDRRNNIDSYNITKNSLQYL